MIRPTKYGGYRHQATTLTEATILLGGETYLAMVDVRPSTPTIYNVSTTDGEWTQIGGTLSGVLAYKLVEENGNDFRYAYTASPTTYMTGFGWVGDNVNITEIYVQRPTATNINMQLLVWTI